MHAQTPIELGTLVRDTRKALGLTQAQLASRIGVGRVWVVRFERGAAEVELGAVLRAFTALGLRLDISRGKATPGGEAPRADQLYPSPTSARVLRVAERPAIDLDALLRGELDP